ncbi:MAG: hypothetical protein WBB28_00835 [Crinalium sp.]
MALFQNKSQQKAQMLLLANAKVVFIAIENKEFNYSREVVKEISINN